jgi:hypothetical protein
MPNRISLTIYKALVQIYIDKWFLLFVFATLSASHFAKNYINQNPIDNKDVSSLLLTYNSLVLSFSISSMTLITAIPSREFVSFLAQKREINGKQINTFRNLLISFFQAASAHYIALISVAMMFLLGDDKLSPKDMLSIQNLYILVILLQGWAFLLFGLALRDITALGILYANFISDRT